MLSTQGSEIHTSITHLRVRVRVRSPGQSGPTRYGMALDKTNFLWVSTRMARDGACSLYFRSFKHFTDMISSTYSRHELICGLPLLLIIHNYLYCVYTSKAEPIVKQTDTYISSQAGFKYLCS